MLLTHSAASDASGFNLVLCCPHSPTLLIARYGGRVGFVCPTFSHRFLRSTSTEYSPGKSGSLLCLPPSSAAVSRMLLLEIRTLFLHFCVWGVENNNNKINGRTFLLEHTQHVPCEPLWQHVRSALHV